MLIYYVLHKLRLISRPFPALLVAVAPLFLLGYHLTRKKHAEIIMKLEERHAAAKGDAAA